MPDPIRFRAETAVPLLGMLATVLIAHVMFGGFFPGPAGVGHDYAGGMPAMLAEYFWSRNEGLFAAPWFTPAFCGGIPWFADPGSMFYVFPSLFVRLLALDPLAASYLTFLMFVGVGFLGAYALGRRALGFSMQAALVAGVIFGLNGFFTHRMLVGHLGFHGIMLAPWLALAVASGPTTLSWRSPATLLRIAGGALVLAYWVHGGVQSLMLAFGLASAALILLAWLRGADIRSALLRSSLILPLGLALAASKLSASFAYLAQFPRSDYRLPGFGSLLETFSVAFFSLFGNLADIATFAAARLENRQWGLDRQELEYGVTAVPALLLIVGFVLWLVRSQGLGRPLRRSAVDGSTSLDDLDPQPHTRWSNRERGLAILLAVLLLLPLLLNTYSPAWNEFLKGLPLIGSSSSLVRWFVIYVPIVAIGAAAVIDSASTDREIRTRIAAVSVIVFVGLNAIVDRQFYRAQNYDPLPVVTAFRSAALNPEFTPRVEAIGAFLDQNRNILLTLNRNDTLVQNVSQLACYMPIFGYRLEYFPFKSLALGPVMQESNGMLNLKNPACFVFPAENQCAAGDHFPVSRKADAERFAAYREFAFEKSERQKTAEWISAIALVILGALLAIGTWQLMRHRRAH